MADDKEARAIEKRLVAEANAQDERQKKLDEQQKVIDEGFKRLEIATANFKKVTEAAEVARGRNLTLAEIGEGRGIELITEQNILKNKSRLAAEAFANEVLLVNVSKSGIQGDLPVVVVTVNGTNQAIIRGRDQRIKRKYVEALARSRITNYEQSVPDPSKPDVIQMNDNTALTFPFRVIEDPNERGPEWLQNILDQP